VALSLENAGSSPFLPPTILGSLSRVRTASHQSRSVVCGVDDSSYSRAAAAVAASFAERLADRLVITRVTELGDQARVLREVAVAENAELAVIGHRAQSPRGDLPGSASAALRADMPCPLVTVPAPAARRGEGWRGEWPASEPRVVCGIDDSHQALRALLVAAHLTRRLDGELILVHACEDFPAAGPRSLPPEFRERAHKLWQDGQSLLRESAEIAAEGIGVDAHVRIHAGDALSSLLGVANAENADLLAVGSHGHRALRARLHGSFFPALVESARVPVLAVPPSARLMTGGRHYELALTA
jgi:nucleotide-binding universal stress UspA family protein